MFEHFEGLTSKYFAFFSTYREDIQQPSIISHLLLQQYTKVVEEQPKSPKPPRLSLTSSDSSAQRSLTTTNDLEPSKPARQYVVTYFEVNPTKSHSGHLSFKLHHQEILTIPLGFSSQPLFFRHGYHLQLHHCLLHIPRSRCPTRMSCMQDRGLLCRTKKGFWP